VSGWVGQHIRGVVETPRLQTHNVDAGMTVAIGREQRTQLVRKRRRSLGPASARELAGKWHEGCTGTHCIQLEPEYEKGTRQARSGPRGERQLAQTLA